MRSFALGLLGISLLAGCASPPGVPDDHYYRLPELVIDSLVDETDFAGTWFVEKPLAEEPRIGRGITYSNDTNHLRSERYHYNHWEEPAPQLVQRRLAAALKASGLATSTVLRPSPDVTWRLASRLDRFDRLIDGTQVSVIVTLELRLSPFDDPHQVIWQRSIETISAAGDDSMEATAAAFGTALDEVLGLAMSELASLKSVGR